MKNLNKTVLNTFILFFFLSTLQLYGQVSQKPVFVILDTDMGNDIDDVLAMDILYKYADQNKVKILGIMNNKDSQYSTQLIDLLNTWYGYPKIPIGKIDKGVRVDDYVDYSHNMIMMNDSTARYKYSVKDHRKLLPAPELYRKILAKQSDASVVIISIGFSTNIAKLLQSNGDKYSKLKGQDLVRKKVRLLSIMAGSFGPKKRAEFNVVNDIPAAQYVIHNWPTEIVLSPFELGREVMYPSKSIANDFQWTAHHPLVDAYKRYRSYPYDRPTWDLTSVYYVANPTSDIFTKSPNGLLTIDDKGFMSFEENPKGQHVVLGLPVGNKGKLKDIFVDLISIRPKIYNH